MYELEGIIRQWKVQLKRSFYLMSPAAIWQMEYTIRYLEELLSLKGGKNKGLG